MHGLIFVELKKYVETRYNKETWEALLDKAGLKHQIYLQSSVYPDGDALALIGKACEMTGLAPKAVLEDFGEFIVPDLIEQYKFLVKPSWGLLDFLENTEETIHKIMRFHKGVTPPHLGAHRLAPDKLVITYSSGRKMCALLRGMVKGSANYYREEATLMESRCMLQGDPECSFTIQVANAKLRPGTSVFQKAVSPRS